MRNKGRKDFRHEKNINNRIKTTWFLNFNEDNVFMTVSYYEKKINYFNFQELKNKFKIIIKKSNENIKF